MPKSPAEIDAHIKAFWMQTGWETNPFDIMANASECEQNLMTDSREVLAAIIENFVPKEITPKEIKWDADKRSGRFTIEFVAKGKNKVIMEIKKNKQSLLSISEIHTQEITLYISPDHTAPNADSVTPNLEKNIQFKWNETVNSSTLSIGRTFWITSRDCYTIGGQFAGIYAFRGRYVDFDEFKIDAAYFEVTDISSAIVPLTKHWVLPIGPPIPIPFTPDYSQGYSPISSVLNFEDSFFCLSGPDAFYSFENLGIKPTDYCNLACTSISKLLEETLKFYGDAREYIENKQKERQMGTKTS